MIGHRPRHRCTRAIPLAECCWLRSRNGTLAHGAEGSRHHRVARRRRASSAKLSRRQPAAAASNSSTSRGTALQTLAPAITLAASEPASFLKHHLDSVVRATRADEAAYIRIVEGSGGRILAWYAARQA